jgi:hypothetical protein
VPTTTLQPASTTPLEVHSFCLRKSGYCMRERLFCM